METPPKRWQISNTHRGVVNEYKLLMAIVVKYRTPNHDCRRNQDACQNTALQEPIRLQFRETRSQAAGNVPKNIPNPLHSLASRI